MKKYTRLRKNNGGFTLAEVLVAVIISVLVIMPVLSSFIMGRATTESAKHRTQAVNLIRERLEFLNSQGYHYINTLPGGMTVEYLTLDENAGGESLQCVRTTTVSDDNGDDILEVEVTVTWTGRFIGGDRTQSESIMTLFAPSRIFE